MKKVRWIGLKDMWKRCAWNVRQWSIKSNGKTEDREAC